MKLLLLLLVLPTILWGCSTPRHLQMEDLLSCVDIEQSRALEDGSQWFRGGASFIDLYLWSESDTIVKVYAGLTLPAGRDDLIPEVAKTHLCLLKALTGDPEYAKTQHKILMARARLGESYERIDRFRDGKLLLIAQPILDSGFLSILWTLQKTDT